MDCGFTGLDSAIGEWTSCWLASGMSESCSDTANNQRQKSGNIFFFFFLQRHFVPIDSGCMFTHKLCVSFGQEQQPTHFVPNGNESGKKKNIAQCIIAYCVFFFLYITNAHRYWRTVDVSLSSAFIWRISLQTSRFPSESSSDLGETQKQAPLISW